MNLVQTTFLESHIINEFEVKIYKIKPDEMCVSPDGFLAVRDESPMFALHGNTINQALKSAENAIASYNTLKKAWDNGN